MIINNYKNDSAIFLKETRFKEKGKYLLFYTENFGLVNAVSFPSKKKTFIPIQNIPTKFKINYYISPRKNIYLKELTLLDNYEGIHKSFLKSQLSWHIISPLRNLVAEGSSDCFLYQLTDRAIKAISKSLSYNNALLILASFYLIIIKHFGIEFSIDKCAKCSSIAIFSLSIEERGMLCKKCSEFNRLNYQIDIKLLKKILFSDKNILKSIKAEKKTIISLINILELYLFSYFSKNIPKLSL